MNIIDSSPNRKNQTGLYMNKNKEYLHKNHSNISIHHRSKLRNPNNQNKKVNDKETENSYFLAPVYQTLKAENYIQNFHYQPSINLITEKDNNINDKYLARKNNVLSLKTQISQISHNGKIENGSSSRLNNEKNESNKNKSVLNYNIDKSLITNSSFYKNIYCSPNRSPETLLINPVKYKDSSHNISEKYLSNKKPKNTVPKFENKNSDNNFEIKKNHFEKKIFNSKNNNKNIEIKVYDLEKGYIENYKLSKIKYTNKEKPKEMISNQKSSNSINQTKIANNNNFNNNFFYKMEVNKSINKNKLIENRDKSKKNSFKSLNKENNKKLNINSFKLENNLKLNSMNTSNKSLNSYSLYKKGIEILKKIINNKKYKYWLSIKQKLLNPIKYSNYKCTTGKIKKNNYLENISPLDVKSQISCTLDNESYYNNSNFIKYKDRHNINLRQNYNSENQKIYNELLSENLELKKINSNILEDKNDLIKKLEIIKEQNKKISKSQRTNNLIFQNQLLNDKLKNISTKYLISKNIYYINNKLKNALFGFNKKAIILKYQNENKQSKLYKMIKLKKNFKNKILRKYFYKYYYITKYLSVENEEYYYEEIQKKIIQKEKLLNIFYKKEKNNYITLKNNFKKLYNNSLLENKKDKLFVIIHNETFIINKNNNVYNFEKIKRKLKLITNNIITKNNMIVKNILKQWSLRTKLINMKNIIDSKEKYKKTINPIENSMKNKMININSKEDNIIKGINKLNNVFTIYRNIDKSNNINDIYNIKEVKNISIKNENIINKINEDKIKYKIKDDWIIEEKEEEQIEENGESTSAKNDTDHIIEDNINNYNNIFFSKGNNNENFEGLI